MKVNAFNEFVLFISIFLLATVASAAPAKSAVIILSDNTTSAQLQADLLAQKLIANGNSVALGYGADCSNFHLGEFTDEYNKFKAELDNLTAAGNETNMVAVAYSDAGSDLANAWEMLGGRFGERAVWLVAGQDNTCLDTELALLKLRGYGVKIHAVAATRFTYLYQSIKVADGDYMSVEQAGAAAGNQEERKCLPFYALPAILIAGMWVGKKDSSKPVPETKSMAGVLHGKVSTKNIIGDKDHTFKNKPNVIFEKE